MTICATVQEHESEVGEVARRLGFTHVSLSSEVMPMVRIVPRGFTASADAYLTPCIKTYLGRYFLRLFFCFGGGGVLLGLNQKKVRNLDFFFLGGE